MKILSSQQIREVDEYTIKNEPITSVDLMERAATSFVQWFIKKFDKDNAIGVLCGIGNNGGDGLAISRMLIEKGYNIKAYAVKPKEDTSDDFALNEKRLKKLTEITYLKKEEDSVNFNDYDLLIDGIFGSGLSRVVDHGIFKKVVDRANDSSATKVAIDIPSGLFADKHTEGGSIINADYTATFQVPKLAFFLPQNYPYVGEWHVLNIGLDNNYITSQNSDHIFLDENQIAWIYNTREKFSHKGDYGKAILISGSYGKIGAAVLAANAALRSGIGLLTIHSPRCGYEVLQMKASEAMVSPDENEKYFSTLPEKLEGYNTLGIGPGLGTDELTLSVFAKLLSEYKKPMVIDADGLNLIAKNHHLLDMVPEYSILTPHPKEFERLAGESENEFDRLTLLRTYAMEHTLYVVLKGQHTAIATPEGKIYFNGTGNPGMATGGTGDVLTGILTALLGQRYTSEEAALLGVYLHGKSGDIATSAIGMDSLVASDIISHLSDAFKHVQKIKNSSY